MYSSLEIIPVLDRWLFLHFLFFLHKANMKLVPSEGFNSIQDKKTLSWIDGYLYIWRPIADFTGTKHQQGGVQSTLRDE